MSSSDHTHTYTKINIDRYKYWYKNYITFYNCFFTCLTYCIFSHIIVVKLMFDNYYRYCLITKNAIFSISIYYVHKQKRRSFVLFKTNQIDLLGTPKSQKWAYLNSTDDKLGLTVVNIIHIYEPVYFKLFVGIQTYIIIKIL